MRRLEFAVLDLTVYEVCNAFWREYRKLHKIIEGEAIQACIISKTLTQYTKLYRVIDLNIGEAMKIAVESNIAIYDSSYIALAHRLGATLSSEDQDIIAVAPKYNVQVIRLRELASLIEEAR